MSLAIVGALPPSQTGIATFNQKAFVDFPVPIDVFAHFPAEADREACEQGMNTSSQHVSVHPAGAFARRCDEQAYDTVVFVLGNSHHNAFVLDLLDRMRQWPRTKVILHVHDVFLFNLVCSSADKENDFIWSDMAAAYDQPWIMSLKGDDTRCNTVLSLHGWLALRSLLHRRRVDKILVNSHSAMELVRAEMGGRLRDTQIARLFHPVFRTDPHQRKRDEHRLRIGSFGIPSVVKRTDVTLDAWRIIKTVRPETELVLAGYLADEFAISSSIAEEEGLCIIDSPSDNELMQQMRSVDVAIQLRRGTRGESSGIVHQLVGLGVPTVVSRIGAFNDLESACVQTMPSASPHQIAKAALAALDDEALPEKMRRYAAEHTVSQFQKRLLAECRVV